MRVMHNIVSSCLIDLAPVRTFKAMTVVFIVALFSAVASAQELSLASSPAPSRNSSLQLDSD